MDTHNEGATVLVALTFADENGGAVIPSAAGYRVTDVVSGAELVAEAAFTPAAATHTLTIPATAQRVIDPAAAYELRAVAVEFTYGNPAKIGTGEVVYRVRNLHALTS